MLDGATVNSCCELEQRILESITFIATKKVTREPDMRPLALLGELATETAR